VNCTIKFHIPGRKPHLPTHGMFKVHRFVFLRDMARVGGEAKSSLEFARRHFAYIGVEEGPECAHCKTVVSPPCWFCSDCQEETYICDDCEYRGLAFGEKHTKMHTVVRVFERGEEKERPTEERLQFLEDKLARMEETLGEVRQTLAMLVEKSGHCLEVGRSRMVTSWLGDQGWIWAESLNRRRSLACRRILNGETPTKTLA